MSHPTFDPETFTITTSDGTLLLRPVRLSDAPNLRNRVANPHNVRYLPHLQGKESQTVAQVEDWIRTVQSAFNRDSLFLVIVDTITQKVIGEGPLGFINWTERWAESGVMLDYEECGKGVASKVLNTTMDFAFKDLELSEVKYGTLQENVAMVKVLSEKLRVKGKGEEKVRKDGLVELNFVFKKDDWLKAMEQKSWAGK